MKRARVVVRGRVQGVGFRWATQRRARSLRLGGWVRNRADGTVEAVFEGTADAVESMVAWCATGPRGAKVDQVEVAWDEAEPAGTGEFSVR